MEKTITITKTNIGFQFLRITLLIAVLVYIIFRTMGFLGFFVEEISCTAEQTILRDKKELMITDKGYRMDNANGRTNERAFEGNYSIKLAPDNQYGMFISFDIPKVNDEYEASVWCYENPADADTTHWRFIVASVGKSFWKGSTEIVEKRNGWGKLQIKFTIPQGVYSDPLVFYCWNNTKNNVYFDNLTIKRKNYWKFFR